MLQIKRVQPDNAVVSGHRGEHDLEHTPCPVCSSSNMSIIHVFGPFKVVSCRACKLLYLNPRLKESAIEDVYQKGAYFLKGGKTGYEDYRSQEASLRITFRRFLKELKLRGMTSGRLLEVGCGYGYFLDEAKDFFSFRAGTELSVKASTYAQRMAGAEIFVGTIDVLPSHLKDFDTIVLINVIEHIYAPVEFLRALLQRLGDSGTIVIATPDIGSFWYSLMKKKWPSFKIPEHVVFYTEKTLSSLLERAGFHTIEKIPFLHAFPLNVIVSRLGIHSQKASCRKPIWIPRTMIALAGRTP